MKESTLKGYKFFPALILVFVGALPLSKSLTHLLFVFFAVGVIGVFLPFLFSRWSTKESPLSSPSWLWRVGFWLFPLGILVNIFSLGSWEAVKNYLLHSNQIFILPIFYCFWRAYGESSRKWIHVFLYACLLGSFYSFFNFFYHFSDYTTGEKAIRVSSFMIFDRWGSYAMMAFLSAAVLAIEGVPPPKRQPSQRPSSEGLLWEGLSSEGPHLRGARLSPPTSPISWIYLPQWAYGIFALIFLVSLLLAGGRGPLLGAFISLVLSSFFFWNLWRKQLKWLGLIFLFIVLGIGTVPSFQKRVLSIFDVQMGQEGSLTSKDLSNLGRFHIWKYHLEFAKENPWFGVGAHNLRGPLTKWLKDHSSQSEEALRDPQFSLDNSHNMYLHQVVQMGLPYALIYFIFIFAVVIRILILYRPFSLISSPKPLVSRALLSPRTSSSSEVRLAFSVVLAELILCLFYTGLVDFVGYMFFFYFSLLLDPDLDLGLDPKEQVLNSSSQS